MKKIKIVYLLPGFKIGGIEKQLTRQWVHFDQNRFEIHLVTIFDSGEYTLFDQIPKYINIHKINLRKKTINNFIKLINIFFKIKPDIVVSSMFSANFLNRILKIFFRYIAIPRENNIYSDKKKIHFVTEKILSLFTDKYIGVSKEVIDFASTTANIPKDKFIYIPNGIEFKKELKIENINKTELKNKLNLNKNLKYFINVARIKPQKNHAFLLDFFKEYKKNNNNWGLIILGDGSDMPVIKNKIKKEKIKDVYLLGYQKNTEEYYLSSDIFVLTSTREGFPNVVLEALSYGLPILTSNVAGVSACVTNENNGYICDLDIKQFISCTNKIIEKQKQNKNYTKLIRQTAMNFDIIKIAKIYQDLFIELYEKNNS